VPVIAPGYTFSAIGEKISNIVLSRPISLGWIFGFLIVFSLMNVLMLALGYLFIKGTGIWGINIPIGWGFAIVVDRYRPRGHADFGDSCPAPADLA
jgi:molybdopterin-containing oxidoreductase family membrane subunit